MNFTIKKFDSEENDNENSEKEVEAVKKELKDTISAFYEFKNENKKKV